MNVDDVREEVEVALTKLAPCFDPRCKLTFVMRTPFTDDADMVVTNDPDIEAVAAAVLKLYSGSAPLKQGHQ